MGVDLQSVADDLLAATRASRVTIRGPRHAGEVGTHLLAEALAQGIESMADAPQVGIAEAPTYVHLRTERRPLLQNDCREDPLPPAMLTERYRVGAQMLGPLLDGDELLGTVSVHEVGGTRVWSAADADALDAAVARVHGVWGR
jgi:GAF domain-containing protein